MSNAQEQQRQRGKSNGGVPRGVAARVVDNVLRKGQTLERSLDTCCKDSVSDLAQIKALSFGALRWHHRHQKIIALLLDRPLRPKDSILEALLSVGLFELHDQRQPEFAIVSACVEATRFIGRGRASGLINAALRRFQRESESVLATVLETDTGRYSHPEWLIRCLQKQLPDQWEQVLDAAQAHPPLWVRVNRARITIDAYRQRLTDETGISAAVVEGFPDALRLDKAMSVTKLPGFTEGLVSIQDAASQLVADFLATDANHRVLDACAAPGGKTSHLLERSSELQLVAIDIDADRNALLAENLNRLGLSATVLTGDALDPASWWDGKPFDRIMVDAPCSATGVIRRHPDIKFLRREKDLDALALRQYELLKKLWPLLKPGGRILYTTCSLLEQENHQPVGRFLADHPDSKICQTGNKTLRVLFGAQQSYGYQLLPGTGNTDGFYYALMEKGSRDPAKPSLES